MTKSFWFQALLLSISFHVVYSLFSDWYPPTIGTILKALFMGIAAEFIMSRIQLKYKKTDNISKKPKT